ncbi:MAG: thioredoxin family protein [Chloroflexota bacterium]
MHIKVLGPGCMNCATLAKRAEQAVKEMGLDAIITKVTDYETIARYGVLKTPALVVEERLLFYGKVPTVAELKEYLSQGNN